VIDTTLVERTELVLFPSVLGSSDPGKIAQGPVVRLAEVAGGVRFVPTTCVDPTMTSVALGPMAERLWPADVTVKSGYLAFTDELVPYFGKPDTIRVDGTVVPGRYTVYLRVSGEDAEAIQDREHQHVEDFTLAFKLSCGALVTAIDDLATQVFPEAADALAALAAAVAPELVPGNPSDTAAWTAHAVKAYKALAGLSNRRDGWSGAGGDRAATYEHQVSWQATAEPAGKDELPRLYLTPVMGTRQKSSEELVTWSEAVDSTEWTFQAPTTPAPATGELVVPFAVNQEVRLTQQYTLDSTTIPTGTTGRYDGLADDAARPLMFYFETQPDYISDMFPRDILPLLEALTPTPTTPQTTASDDEGSPPDDDTAPDAPAPEGTADADTAAEDSDSDDDAEIEIATNWVTPETDLEAEFDAILRHIAGS
jgi:hypothetical protein